MPITITKNNGYFLVFSEIEPAETWVMENTVQKQSAI
jgi:hypothetical protein